MLQYFRQFRVVENDLKLFCDVYIMLCHVLDPEPGNSLVGNKKAMRGLYVLVVNSLEGILFSS